MATVQVEALWHNWTRDPALAPALARGMAKQYLSWDLTTGRVEEGYPLYAYLRENGVTGDDLAWLRANAACFDVFGANYYPWGYGEKALKPNGEEYRIKRPTHGSTLARVIGATAQRYDVPILITETSAIGTPLTRGRWMDQTLAAVRDLRATGVPLVGYTWFPLFTMIEWDYRIKPGRLEKYLLHLGLYDSAFDDAGVLRRHATPLVERYRRHMAEPMPAIGSAAAPASAPAPAAAPAHLPG
jgi:hypothetical protein